MARALVVCCDGTWDTPSDDTNVRRLYEALDTTDDQLPRYFDGLGTSGNPVRRLLDGALGLGLDSHVREAYRWIADTWAPGDTLVLVGFSRGAFTVRSLAGMLSRCGLVAFADGASDAERDRLVRRVYDEGYREGRVLADVPFATGFGPGDSAPITFLGVWDTVGALGVPVTFGLLSRLTRVRDVRFHDTELDDDVRHARQALALDERRGPYVPAVWQTPPAGRHGSFAQLWFPGTHGDVGGGEKSRALSDTALAWMAGEATAAVGLRWRTDLTAPAGDPCAVVPLDPTGLWRYLSPRPRAAPRVAPDAADVHASAVARRDCPLVPPYRPGVVPAVGERHEAVVPAGEPWTETGLYLETGRYRIAASGSWSDHGVPAPPTGVARWPVRSWPAYAVGTALDGVRWLAQRLGGPRADVVGSRRVPEARWMELVCAVANDVLHPDGSLDQGPTVPVGPAGERDLDVARPGYLYAFANDAWTGYGSNAGAVVLTVTRVS